MIATKKSENLPFLVGNYCLGNIFEETLLGIPAPLRDGPSDLRLHSAQIFLKNVTQKITSSPKIEIWCFMNSSNYSGA